MNILEAFPSKYLKGDDFPAPAQFTIQGVAMEQLQDGTTKPAVSFAETQQLLILNKTNSLMLAHMLGGETTGWGGNKIELYTEPTAFQGKIVNAIRVRVIAAQPPGTVPAQPVAAVPPVTVDTTADIDW